MLRANLKEMMAPMNGLKIMHMELELHQGQSFQPYLVRQVLLEK